jgi:hypothetical protein
MLLLFIACQQPLDEPVIANPLATAIVDASRATHFLDHPYPSDDLGSDLAGFPNSEGILGGVIQGWADRVPLATQGFSANGAVWFRFDASLEVPTTTPGLAQDPFLLIDMATGELHPLDLLFVEDPLDDPFFAPNTLSMVPQLGSTPRSGSTLAAVVMASARVDAPAGYALPTGVTEALTLAGVTGTAAVATVYTTQPATEQLQALITDVDARPMDYSDVADFQRIVSLSFAQGEINGNAGTEITATLENGDTSVSWEQAGEDDFSIDLLDWPLDVYLGEIPVWNYSGLEDRPYMRPGAGHLLDVDDYTGWYDFDGVTLRSEPEVEWVRAVVSLPPGSTDAPIVFWNHGTGGSATNSVQRALADDKGRDVAAAFADSGWAIVSLDSPMYGTRYPLIAEGFTDGATGFYNIVNLPAFRDNQRQTAIEGRMLAHFVDQRLNDVLPTGTVDGSRLRRFGHSLGSVTSHLNVAATPQMFESSFVSGSGGVLSLMFLETGLVGTGHGLFDQLSAILGIPEGQTDVRVMLGYAAGIQESEAHERISRHHPFVSLFQWIIDAGDPASVARDVAIPTTLFMGVGDRQVPNSGTHALDQLIPDSTLIECETSSDYEPHWCLFREPEGPDAIRDWLAD